MPRCCGALFACAAGLAQFKSLEVGFLKLGRQEFFDGRFQGIHPKRQHARGADHAQQHGVAALHRSGLQAKFAAGHKVALTGNLTGFFHDVRSYSMGTVIVPGRAAMTTRKRSILIFLSSSMLVLGKN